MSIIVAINHKTAYKYDRLVTLSPHIFRLRPAPHCRTPIQAYSLRLRPETHFINWQQDPFGNYLARVVFPERADELYIEVDLVADLTVINPFDFFIDESAKEFPFAYSAQETKELGPYLEKTEEGPLLKKWMSGVPRDTQPTVDFLVALNQRLWQDIAYSVRMEPGVQTCEETLDRAIGSCRDSSWLLVQILRHLGLAARFVSGYLIQLTADVKALDGPSGPDADFTDLHAWAEVYIPGAGWLGLDPTSGLFAGEGHIPLACTPDPVSAAPVTGATDECQVLGFNFSNSVQRLHEDPRVTKPYTDAQWTAIDALGQYVDGALEAADVRLTMGGEPTFVSIDEMEADEWNTTADGEQKRQLAGHLIRRLHNTFGPGGIRHYGQGKWYPGEQLPRWRLACYWRTDGVAMWRNPDLLAKEDKDYQFGLAEAYRFLETLSHTLKVDPKNIKAGYEDAFYFLWIEGKLPTNVNPFQADLKDPLERQKLAKLLERGLDEPTGYVLPVRWDDRTSVWRSSDWLFRFGKMILTPGDSPMGFRLPLDSLPAAEEDRDPIIEQDPFDDRPPLPDFHEITSIENQQADKVIASAPREKVPPDVVRTALCIEPRDGRLFL